MTLRMDNVGIVVESLEAATSFFAELGLELGAVENKRGMSRGAVSGSALKRAEHVRWHDLQHTYIWPNR